MTRPSEAPNTFKPRCYDCEAITLQRVTTQGFCPNIAFEGRAEGRKPYKVRCKRCGRRWKTAAEYARGLSGDAFLTKKT